MTSDEGREEEPASEARRFSAVLSLLHKNVPELQAWKLEDTYGNEVASEPLALAEAWTLVNRHLFDDDDRPVDVDGAWPRLLAVMEAALQLCGLLFDDGRDDDGIAIDVFAGSGIMCDVTRNVASLEALLRWMGPACLESARTEVAAHATSRGYGIDDVNWSESGIAYQTLVVSLPDLVPAHRS